MRNIALTFLGCFTILAACSNSDDAEKPVTPVPTGDVTIYATTSSLTRDLTRDAVNFSSKDNLAPTSITLNPTEQYQTMDGFGAAITGATCFNLLQMKPDSGESYHSRQLPTAELANDKSSNQKCKSALCVLNP